LTLYFDNHRPESTKAIRYGRFFQANEPFPRVTLLSLLTGEEKGLLGPGFRFRAPIPAAGRIR
jgi:hypothetical protein